MPLYMALHARAMYSSLPAESLQNKRSCNKCTVLWQQLYADRTCKEKEWHHSTTSEQNSRRNTGTLARANSITAAMIHKHTLLHWLQGWAQVQNALSTRHHSNSRSSTRWPSTSTHLLIPEVPRLLALTHLGLQVLLTYIRLCLKWAWVPREKKCNCLLCSEPSPLSSLPLVLHKSCVTC
ncbi:hypothetical protein DUNSADRAFT_18416 [Dunaliella salina]|uniref:Encoded protein n=1 Tax=Dunaliella salina TaxID=3046 RepID=A0ABQ7GZ34_DUNSA|nr:hypothetical protein DUNSADRAFT_18416 [Dunaliella salina]|eukprot:KAF5839873.1 hypothetical protein DUNSADRAFT_18416 [Dunaliella salina]